MSIVTCIGCRGSWDGKNGGPVYQLSTGDFVGLCTTCFATVGWKSQTEEPKAPVAPDFFEPILAWRCWAVANSTLMPLTFRGLRVSLNRSGTTEWPYKKRAEASCSAASWRSTHDAPARNCHCGFYGFRTPFPLLKQLEYHHDVLNGRRHIIGLVKLWGRLIEHRSGWRAQYAYPALLCSGGKTVKYRQFSPEELGRRYGVEVFDGTVMQLIEKAMS